VALAIRAIRVNAAAVSAFGTAVAIHTNVPQTRYAGGLMLHYAVVFLIIALIAGALGFFGIAGAAVGIAKILFFVFLVLFVVSLIMGRRGPVT
jgi:uncharacterized membrane protein YtjA (UPF0391 family)